MKKNLLIIIVLCLFVSTPVLAYCSGETANITLEENTLLSQYRIATYRKRYDYGIEERHYPIYIPYMYTSFGTSTFKVDFDNVFSTTFYGYGIEPGYRWPATPPPMCCNDVSNGHYSTGVREALIYLAKLAGDARKSSGSSSNDAVAADIALRLFSMVNGISTSDSTVMGSGYYVLGEYIRLYDMYYREGKKLYPDDPSRVESYLRKSLSIRGYAEFSLDKFLIGPGSGAIISKVYAYFKAASDIKENPSGAKSYISPDIRLDVSDTALTCNSDAVVIHINKGTSVNVKKIIVNGDPSIDAKYSGNRIYIDKTEIFSGATCEDGNVVINIQILYEGGTDTKLYLCQGYTGGRNQSVLTYIGSEGTFGTSPLIKSLDFSVTLPTYCVPDYWATSCSISPIGPGYTGGRCLSSGTVDIKGTINNCCYDPNDANTSTVSDTLDGKSVEESDFDINELFVENPRLHDGLKSIVKCGSQEMTSAKDFKPISDNTTADMFTKFCQMYCIERAHIITPPPVTVTAGRYFELDFNKMDLDEKRTCRISVDLSTIFSSYIQAVTREITAFNQYYYNKAHYELYETLSNNGYNGSYRSNVTKKITIQCKRVASTAYCDSNVWYKPEPKALACTNNVPNDGVIEKHCILGYDKLDFSRLPRDWFPYIRAQLEEDVGAGTGSVGYDQPNTHIQSKIDTGNVNYASFRKEIKDDIERRGFFTLSYSNGCKGDLWELAGKPDCWCPGGQPIPATVVYYTKNKICKCGGYKVKDIKRCWEDPIISGCSYDYETVTNELSNSVLTGSGGTFSCKISDADKRLINYVTNPNLGYYPDFMDEKDSYNVKTGQALNDYQAAVARLKTLESTFRECIDYFEPGFSGASDIPSHYDISAITTSFEYNQVFSAPNGKSQTSTTQGNITHNCHVQLVNVSEQYDSGFQTTGINYIKLQGFHKEILPYQTRSFDSWEFPGFTSMQTYLEEINNSDYGSETYQKKVTVDGTYIVVCDFQDEGNDYYTLVPGGYSSSTLVGSNYVSHSKLLSTNLTTYEGKHEILYHITGLGSQIARKFDPYFQVGSTCSGQSSAANLAPASCYIDVKQRMVTTGTCSGVTSADNYSSVCDVTCAGDGTCSSIYNFMFKLVEPSDLFPNGINDTSGWGKNWLTTEGNTTRSVIENLGSKDMTYSPESLTYSFTLAPKTIEAIKKYNSNQIEIGGYNDFNLNCRCGTNGSNACTHCTSRFLSDLAQRNTITNVNMAYTSTTPLWNNSLTITEVRNRNHNWDKDDTAARAILH